VDRVATYFAPAERAAPEETDAQHRKLAESPLVRALLDSFPESAVILNQQRQILFANDKLAALLGHSRESLIGLRHGEALDCIHAVDQPGGCGTTRFCRYCGAAHAILNSQRSAAPDVQECRIQRRVHGATAALDLRVWTTPVTVEGKSFTVFAVRDTTDEKRRQLLERLFFHDSLNAVAGLSAILDMWPEPRGEAALELTQMAREYADELAEVIQSQRDLAAAECGDLEVNPVRLNAADLLDRLRTVYSYHSTAERKSVVVSTVAEEAVFVSDKTLLARVLGNLIKNALEASAPGQTVTLSFLNDGGPTFCVHNESPMPEEVQAQMFQRSFSTKSGSGRGVGAYSVKLLTESYLKGTVAFRSTPTDGTTFTVRLPRSLQQG
jgi:signal transduction histidine kinase